VFDRLGARHLPCAHVGDDLEIGCERLEGDVEAHLVVALARAAVRHRLGAALAGGIDHQLGDQRPAQRRGERVLALVQGAGHQGGEDEAVHEQVARVDGDGVHGPGLRRLFADLLDVLALAEALGSPTRFESEPRSLFQAHRDMRQRGLEVLAVYHSHPSSAPVPSKTDLERNWSEDVVNLIVSLVTDPPTVRAWWLTADSY